MKGSITNCNVTLLKNHSELYYQFNCDSVWLTLKSKSGIRKIIYSMKGDTYKDLYGYNYRLGYQLAKEYNKYLLFRYACPANGPCNFVIINKTTGSTVKKLGELIYDHYDGGKFYKFILYFSNPNRFNYLTLYYVDSQKKYFIPINAKDINGAIPEYIFNTVQLKGNTLILEYPHLKTNRWMKKIVLINLLKYPG